MKKAPKVLTRMRLSCCWGDNLNEKELNNVVDYINELEQQCKKQKEVIDDCKEDISHLLDIINKNCNELKCTSDEQLVIQKYQDKEVLE